MLFELTHNYSRLQPVAFQSFSDVARTEKDLEDLLAQHLFDVLFSQTPLLPFHQERPYQAVADIYALNEEGDIIIFELKRDQADSEALEQLLRYVGEAGLWSFKEIQRRYNNYRSDSSSSLLEAHSQTFNIDPGTELRENEFNRNQHLWVVGNAADEHLIRSIDYWKTKGLSIDFFPYRIYQIGESAYFEFFAKPYDYHLNPGLKKGILFDTNRSWDHVDGGYGCLQEMMLGEKISAYGERKVAVLCLQPNDYVFYSHVGIGVVGAGRVKGRNVKKMGHPEYGEEWYLEVELLTPVPKDFKNIPAIGFSEIKNLLAKGFYWARIDKRPYLSVKESESLLKELRSTLGVCG
jgi:hypothetical protein